MAPNTTGIAGKTVAGMGGSAAGEEVSEAGEGNHSSEGRQPEGGAQLRARGRRVDAGLGLCRPRGAPGFQVPGGGICQVTAVMARLY